MFSQIIDKITGLLEGRFTLTYFLPASITVGTLTLASWLATGHSVSEIGVRWSAAGVATQVIVAISVVGAAFLVALVYAGNSLLIIQLFEGYVGPAKWLSGFGVPYHRRHMSDMAYELRHFLYPIDESKVMPTKLGNTLRAAEEYSRDTYGLDSVIIWPRLFRLLPAEFIQDLATARQQLELPLMICFSGCLVAVASALVLPATDGGGLVLYAAAVGGALVIAYLSYHAATGAALAYAELIKSTFDIYRLRLLKELGLPIPRFDAEERILWQSIANSWYRGGPMPRA